MDLLDKLNWRYATKKMDPARFVPQDKVERILEIREKIVGIANGQRQVVEGSHLLVFAAWDDYTPARINMMFDLNNEIRGFSNAGSEGYRRMLLDRYPARGAEVNFQHAAKQAYIALGIAMIAAAFEAVDSTPMEGFDPDALDELLNLRARGLRSVLMLPLGYREPDKDWLANLKKVRRARAAFVTEIK
jgi:nitroreductase